MWTRDVQTVPSALGVGDHDAGMILAPVNRHLRSTLWDYSCSYVHYDDDDDDDLLFCCCGFSFCSVGAADARRGTPHGVAETMMPRRHEDQQAHSELVIVSALNSIKSAASAHSHHKHQRAILITSISVRCFKFLFMKFFADVVRKPTYFFGGDDGVCTETTRIKRHAKAKRNPQFIDSS